MALDPLPDAHRFLCFYVLFISDFGYSYVRQTKMASCSLVNFLAHDKILID